VLQVLREAGAGEQVAALAAWVAVLLSIDNPYVVAELLESMREVGAGEQATALAARLPAVGRFSEFLHFSGQLKQFRLGREPDGSATPYWTWADLD
jgi:hypothetical protein